MSDLISRQDIKWHDILVADGNGQYHNEKVAYKSQIDDLPSAQPELFEDRLKELADAVSEKMAYMNTCPNERDTILGILGVPKSGEIHCNTDCRQTDCKSYHFNGRQPEPCEDAVSRQQAIDAVENWEKRVAYEADYTSVRKVIEELPSVTPQRKGEWKTEYDTGTKMLKCSVCGCRVISEHYFTAVGTSGDRFCPYCGTMLREDES